MMTWIEWVIFICGVITGQIFMQYILNKYHQRKIRRILQTFHTDKHDCSGFRIIPKNLEKEVEQNEDV